MVRLGKVPYGFVKKIGGSKCLLLFLQSISYRGYKMGVI